MKKICMLLAAALLLGLISSSGYALEEGGFVYSVVGGEAKITAYSGHATELTLPAALGGYPVTAISYCAFRNCASLTSVVIPEGVVSIGSNPFQNCTSLSDIRIPESVTAIGTHAFYACSSLKQIHLHDNLDRINILAFYGCSAARICSPDSLTAFVLTDIGYSFTHPDYPALTLKAFEDDGQRTFTVSDCDESAESVSFPEGVTAIERSAFFGCSALTEIVIPDGVREIASSAFAGCCALTQITIPGSVESIEGDAFSGCSDLTIISPHGSAGQAFAQANGLAWQSM